MATPQPGIFAQGTPAHLHLEYDLRADVSPGELRPAIAELVEPDRAAGGTNLVLGFGSGLWRRIGPSTPAALTEFRAVEGPGRRAPATQHDLWIWVHGTGPDVVFDRARAAHRRLASYVNLRTDLAGFVYRDSRDLTGFIDGTENPTVEEAPAVAVIPDGPGAGGSYALTMRWVHNLGAFDALDPADQERVIGRTKPDSIELPDHRKPPTAHIARVVIEEHGEELEIYRRSIPYGTVAEHGLFFVAFSADPTRFFKMLDRMFGISGDGLRDRLTDFSTPLSGSLYFVPSLEELRQLGGGPSSD